jgi:hypothetical protein
MDLPTQAEFVRSCMDKYFFTELPDDQKWEEAHYPQPECLGGEDIIQLWAADHVVQGLLQSVELDHKCFNERRHKSDLIYLTTYYPEYLELFEQLKSRFSSRASIKAVRLKLGIHGLSGKERSANGRIGGEKTGRIGGATNAKNKTGVCGRSAEQMSIDGKKGGEKAAKLKVGACGRSAAQMTADVNKVNTQKWQCLITGYISNPGALARYQNARGIDTKFRVKLS